MAVALEFINFIVPIEIVKSKYPGGWDNFVKENADSIGETMWYDKYLVRDGAMSRSDMEYILNDWKKIGINIFNGAGKKKNWKDCCIIEGVFGSPTFPCEWIAITEDGRAAFLKGTEPGPTVGRSI